MLVRELMTPNPVTVRPDTPVPDALRLMRERKVRRLPVVDSHGRLVGIVSDKDLLYASPSPATTLAVWEIPDILGKLKIEKVMTHDVVTVSEKTPLEEAARLMADKKIGGLPVMQGPDLVGIITETDLFKNLLELLGGRRSGVRLAVAVPAVKGELSKITTAIFEAGGNIVGIGMKGILGSHGDTAEIVLKVQDVDRDKLVEAVRPVVSDILDVREVDQAT
ncbi:CBS domain containing protein [Candidatus Promineifilum breve]|uniref:CBS domain containing protein n=1 Tax=Candidatus Promineifilum breve TaxID=1806508 RepID=A0A160T2V3_9CHLR|nr:CBS domain-containing protein [Candidatus Promineifilum breve]CUS04054.2 CBS domain containing protein [Candidatus Promineifilum breve]